MQPVSESAHLLQEGSPLSPVRSLRPRWVAACALAAMCALALCAFCFSLPTPTASPPARRHRVGASIKLHDSDIAALSTISDSDIAANEEDEDEDEEAEAEEAEAALE